MTRDELSSATEFIERMGLASEADGLPRIAGRIFATMLIDGGPCTFDDLVNMLQVSRGSISTNTRLLEALGVIERFTRPGERHDYFRFTGDPFGLLIERSLERMQKLRTIVADANKSLPESLSGARGRLKKMEDFYDFAIESTRANLQTWRARQHPSKRS